MDTKGHCFPKSIIIQAVYLKLRFTLSYRDVEEILRIRGVEVDHARNRNPDTKAKEGRW
jgi:putative transposase